MTATPVELRTIRVELSSHPYPVLIGNGSLQTLGERIAELGMTPATRVLLVTNPDVERHYGDRALNSLKSAGFQATLLAIEAGENQKNPASIARIHDAAFERRLERGSLIIALGGGVVGDMAGFAAATWLRGIALVQVPTTLLAMVDASIGGKTGVNHPGGKNLIGAFHQPRLVLIDPTTLATLPPREFRAGMAEVIKYGVIGDAPLFLELEAAALRRPEDGLASVEAVGAKLLRDLLERSAAAKAQVVAADERESGLRAILNYGHTLGHVLETLCGYGNYLHGEAVGLGMLAAGEIACSMKLWTRTEQERQRRLVQAAGLPCTLPSLNPERVLSCLQGDKKVRNGRVRFVLPTGIGSVQIRDDVESDVIIAALDTLTPSAKG
ncbi:MAG: 3-dehydroquinate synthase [Cyanobacteriota bacterium]|nr:3-dehydroquinate synthase [Cyanobacteriota bacterium]